MDIKTVSERLRQSLPAHAVQTDVPMSEYTTFRIGGPCDLMVLPETEEQAVFAINVLREMEAPFVVVGNGSNILVADAGYRGCVVHMVGGGHTIAVDERAGRVYAGAGENMLTVARFCAEHGLAGMECVSGIPGSLGGTVAMNAGAYEKEMKDVVHAVRILKPNGTVEWVPCAEMGFGYRTSRVQKENWIVLGVALQLFKDDPAATSSPCSIRALAARSNGRRAILPPN